jgi:hypothetical protein
VATGATGLSERMARYQQACETCGKILIRKWKSGRGQAWLGVMRLASGGRVSIWRKSGIGLDKALPADNGEPILLTTIWPSGSAVALDGGEFDMKAKLEASDKSSRGSIYVRGSGADEINAQKFEGSLLRVGQDCKGIRFVMNIHRRAKTREWN